MKPGRPKSHIKGKWVTWKENNKISFYELDQKENLIRINNQIQPHHIIDNDLNKATEQDNVEQNDSNQVVLKPKISEIDNFVKDSTSVAAKPAPVLTPEIQTSPLFDCTLDLSSVLIGDNETDEFQFFDSNSDQDEIWWK